MNLAAYRASVHRLYVLWCEANDEGGPRGLRDDVKPEFERCFQEAVERAERDVREALRPLRLP